jgi:hypothetical protein
MSRKINWSDAPFSWPAEPALDEKTLNSPQPCSHGSACRYDGPCAFVHKGEEGTGRRLFPARTTQDKDGKNVEQAACVRLIGSPGFYERRRLRLSWPEWCAKKGIQHGASGSAAAASGGQAKPGVSAAPTTASVWPVLSATGQRQRSFAAAVASAPAPAPAPLPLLLPQPLLPQPLLPQQPLLSSVIQQNHLSGQAAAYGGYGMPPQQIPPHMHSAVWAMNAAIAQHGSVEAALEFNRRQQEMLFMSMQQQSAFAASAKEVKDDYGQKLYDKLVPCVADLQASMGANWPKSATAGKLTGIFLELDKDDWDQLLSSDDAMYEKVGEALEMLKEEAVASS